MTRTAVVATALTLAGCSNLLGFSAPHEAIDAGSGSAHVDAAPIDAGPATIHVITGGTAGSSAGVITSDPAGISCPGTCDFTFPANTQVTLTATAGAGSGAGVTFTGFHGGACSGDASATCAFTAGGDATIFARYFVDTNIVFTSSTQQAGGSFNVVGNADALCNQLAGSAGLPGNYAAWLSTEQSAVARITAQAPNGVEPSAFVRPDGQFVLPGDLSGLAAGDIQFPPRLDEFGSDVGDAAVVLTDTDSTGSANTGSHCSDWASTANPGQVLFGEAGGGTGRWTDLDTIGCSTPAHLYCVGIHTVHHDGQLKPSAAILFVSKGTFAGNGGLGSADAMCRTEAQDAGLPGTSTLALITPGGGASVASRFTGLLIAGPVQRPDSPEVAPSVAALLAGSAFESPPNVNADGDFVDLDVWVGGKTFAVFQEDCAGWTSRLGTQSGATRPAATTDGSEVVALTACSSIEHILCLDYTAAED